MTKAMDMVRASRDPQRKKAYDYINYLCDPFVELQIGRASCRERVCLYV